MYVRIVKGRLTSKVENGLKGELYSIGLEIVKKRKTV